MPNIEQVFVFPNMGDGGLSYGAAALAHLNRTGKRPAAVDTMYLGPEYSDSEIEAELAESGFSFERKEQIAEDIADLLARGEVVARFHGRMEFGPRALGNRSLLYKASDPSVNKWLNDRLNRSEFMPFAPATLKSYASASYIGIEKCELAAPYMTATFACTPQMLGQAPAAVHIDGTARPQIVSAEKNPDFHRILSAYFERTGTPSLINTSFNMHEEPIVCSPLDAVRAVRDGNLKYLAIGNYLAVNPNA